MATMVATRRSAGARPLPAPQLDRGVISYVMGSSIEALSCKNYELVHSGDDSGRFV